MFNLSVELLIRFNLEPTKASKKMFIQNNILSNYQQKDLEIVVDYLYYLIEFCFKTFDLIDYESLLVVLTSAENCLIKLDSGASSTETYKEFKQFLINHVLNGTIETRDMILINEYIVQTFFKNYNLYQIRLKYH